MNTQGTGEIRFTKSTCTLTYRTWKYPGVP